MVQRFGVGLVIERSLVRLPAGALSSQLGQISLPSLRGIGKLSTSLHARSLVLCIVAGNTV